jgi:NADPH:quinone reductase-like Zn-dependent oxidoreductase
MMRAIVLTSFSGVNGLALAEVADPIPAEGEQLVHVRAASLGPWDVESAEGAFAALSRRSCR